MADSASSCFTGFFLTNTQSSRDLRRVSLCITADLAKIGDTRVNYSPRRTHSHDLCADTSFGELLLSFSSFLLSLVLCLLVLSRKYYEFTVRVWRMFKFRDGKTSIVVGFLLGLKCSKFGVHEYVQFVVFVI